MKKNIFSIVFISILFLISCGKDDSLQLVETENIFVEIPHKIISRSNYSRGNLDNDPSFLVDIENRLNLDQSYNEFHEVHTERYGKIAWNYATLDFSSTNYYILCLPYKKEGEITGFLLFMGDHDHHDIRFIGKRWALENAYIGGTVNKDQDVIFGIAQAHYYDLSRKGISRKFYSDFLSEVAVESTIKPRTRIVEKWVDSVEADGEGYYLVSRKVYYFVECGGGGGPIDPSIVENIPIPPGGINPEVSEQDKTIESILDQITIDEDCLNEMATQGALEVIESSLDIFSSICSVNSNAIIENVLVQMCEDVASDCGANGCITGENFNNALQEALFDGIGNLSDLTTEQEHFDVFMMSLYFTLIDENCNGGDGVFSLSDVSPGGYGDPFLGPDELSGEFCDGSGSVTINFNTGLYSVVDWHNIVASPVGNGFMDTEDNMSFDEPPVFSFSGSGYWDFMNIECP